MSETDKTKKPITQQQLNTIVEKLSRIQYGTVTLVVQDGVLVQIESTEKIRLR